MSLKKRTKRINIDKSYSQLTFKQALDMAIRNMGYSQCLCLGRKQCWV
ncbi:hypothetical protein PVOR_29494 [Paenibacillus vortex V453]|uniref:Uncharacterized protein n=1 Tax=Paenibacillus vortex V453 TaxID=715225 RepID=A0A2R9SME9_9BACL|nr:hypothetical protein PVOR_29494 [Paenibacillus vortex V453]